MRERGLEPPRLAALVPKTSVSTIPPLARRTVQIIPLKQWPGKPWYGNYMNDANIQTYQTAAKLAGEAADQTVKVLKAALDTEHQAVWVLAGGSTPALAYQILAANYANAIDWSKVIVLMGDERIVSLTHKDSNWGQVSPYLDALGVSDENRLVPYVEGGAEGAAADYDQLLRQLPRLDVVWLGIGEDGHTLSLFPGRESNPNSLAMPVHNSPKPPADRVSLTLAALQKAKTCFILAAGEGKAPVIEKVLKGDESLPIAQAAQVVTQSGGTVRWLLDAAARGTLLPT